MYFYIALNDSHGEFFSCKSEFAIVNYCQGILSSILMYLLIPDCHDSPLTDCNDAPLTYCHDGPLYDCHDGPSSDCHDGPLSDCHDVSLSVYH